MGDSERWQRIRSPAATEARETNPANGATSLSLGESSADSQGSFIRNPLSGLHEHYAVVFPLLYGYFTVLGMFYSYFLYKRFGINIWDYAEIGDFLLAAFRNRAAFWAGVVLVMGLVMGVIVMQLLRNLLSLDKEIVWTSTAVVFIFLALLAPIFIILFGVERRTNSIKEGFEQKLEVRYRSYSGSADQVTEPDLELIGATQKVVFFYDVKDKPEEK